MTSLQEHPDPHATSRRGSPFPTPINFWSVIGNTFFYLLWKAGSDLKTKADNSLEHWSVQVSKQRDSRAKGPDGRTPPLPSFSSQPSIKRNLPDEERISTISRKEPTLLKKRWMRPLFLTLPPTWEVACQTLSAFIWHRRASSPSYTAAHTSKLCTFRKSLLSLSIQIILTPSSYTLLWYTLSLCPLPFLFFTPQNGNTSNTTLKW